MIQDLHDLNPDHSNSVQKTRRFWPRGLSGKLLVLTMLVIMATEIFVFVPSVANFRLTWLANHFVTGEAASLALEELSKEQIPDSIRDQLLQLTQTEIIVVRREGVSSIIATKEMPGTIARHVELQMPGRAQAVRSIAEALDTLLFGGDRVIRVFGPMQQRDGTLELVMKEKPLRDAMLSYAGNVLLISLGISVMAGVAVFWTLRQLLISPLQKMTGSMLRFARNPEDSTQVIQPSGRDDEIGVAEEQLGAMQERLRGTFTQQRHLADLGLAVSKINHDLRNILASASLFSERMSNLSDPMARRLAPRLVRTIDRAVDYTTSVLAYGKAGEALPKRRIVRLHRLCEDVAETLALTTDEEGNHDGDGSVEWINNVPVDFEVAADAEQLFRVIMNLCRNAVQAMALNQDASLVRRLTVEARRVDKGALISVSDTGPGFPEEAKANLFTAFQTSGRNGGTGLGLAIAAEIIRAHGGAIVLVEDNEPGTQFDITLPSA